jgi:hypothetical protein
MSISATMNYLISSVSDKVDIAKGSRNFLKKVKNLEIRFTSACSRRVECSFPHNEF